MAHELVSVAEMHCLDAEANALGVSTAQLMERAGWAAAEMIARRRDGRAVFVACGPGANGGDGLVAARLLRAGGAQVEIALLNGRSPTHPAAAAAFSAWDGPAAKLDPLAMPGDALLVDALFGAGLSRPLDSDAAAFALGSAGRALAIDVPSGLPGDGAPPSGPVVRAAGAITFVRKKPAHVLEPGRSLCGEVIVADIGMPAAAWRSLSVQAFENHPDVWRDHLPRPARTAHKHQRGHVMALSGPVAATGAARLAAMGALRAGAGLVSVLSPPGALLVNAAHLTAIMLRPFGSLAEFVTAAAGADAVVLGPGAGVGPELAEQVLSLAGRAPLVLDADALTSFQEAPERLFAALRPCDTLTPHWGEFRRLFPDLAQSDAGKLAIARAAAHRSGAIVLLKGSDTVVAAPDGRAVVNATGTPYLATAGSGDVLAGVIAGLIAQGMPSWEAAAAAAWLHGKTGEALGAGLIAEDLPAALPAVLRRLL